MLYCDYPLNYALGFQDPGTNFMYAIIDLHDRIIFFLLIILTIVSWFIISSLTNKDHLSYIREGHSIELIWTITPAIILWMIGIPSLKLLYSMDEILDPQITIKAIGNQWYWSYEYTDYQNPIIFDSFMTSLDSLELGQFRQLNVDNYLILPIATSIRILITSNDVIHSFAVPSLALKCDALPGRLNALGLIINRPSIYYGQCSELCGFAHGFMPIGIKAVPLPEYLSFLMLSSSSSSSSSSLFSSSIWIIFLLLLSMTLSLYYIFLILMTIASLAIFYNSNSNYVIVICYLIIVYIMGSFIFILLEELFLGLSYIIVYVGAIAIIFIFVIMMIPNQNESSRPPFSLFLLLLLLLPLFLFFYYSDSDSDSNFILVDSIDWFTSYNFLSNINIFGYLLSLYTSIPIIIIGYILLIVMIGIIILTS